MPTITGNVWAQFVGWSVAQNAVHTYEVRPNRRAVSAEGAISLLTSTDPFWAETGIRRIVSDSGDETFNPPHPRFIRTGVTLVEFRTAASGAKVRGRHVITYWD